MSNKFSLKSALVLVLIFVLFAGLATGVNSFTAPIIASNAASGELAPLFEIFPEAESFELIYGGEATELADVPATVKSIYKETSGLGYIEHLSTSEGYTKEPIDITMAIDAEGKICSVAVTAYPDSREMGEDYPSSYIGQDSALAEVTLVSSVTISSSAFKRAVEDGFNALIANSLIGAGVKSDDQILAELLVISFGSMANNEAVAQYEEREGDGASVIKSMKALNDGGFAYMVNDGSANILVLVNATGSAKALSTEGEDITSAVDAAIIEQCVTAATSEQASFSDKEIKRLSKLCGEGAEINALPMENIFSSVSGVYEIKDADATLYGFATRSYGFGNQPLTSYYVLDAEGAIVAMNVDELILEKDYFNAYELDEPSYKEGFGGVTVESFNDDVIFISGATVTSNAMRTATNDVFAAFEQIMQNGGK